MTFGRENRESSKTVDRRDGGDDSPTLFITWPSA